MTFFWNITINGQFYVHKASKGHTALHYAMIEAGNPVRANIFIEKGRQVGKKYCDVCKKKYDEDDFEGHGEYAWHRELEKKVNGDV